MRQEAKDQLAETGDILRTVGDGLASRGSRYAAAFAALLAHAGEPVEMRLAGRHAPGDDFGCDLREHGRIGAAHKPRVGRRRRCGRGGRRIVRRGARARRNPRPGC